MFVFHYRFLVKTWQNGMKTAWAIVLRSIMKIRLKLLNWDTPESLEVFKCNVYIEHTWWKKGTTVSVHSRILDLWRGSTQWSEGFPLSIHAQGLMRLLQYMCLTHVFYTCVNTCVKHIYKNTSLFSIHVFTHEKTHVFSYKKSYFTYFFKIS